MSSDDLRTLIAAAIMQTCHGVYLDDAVDAADAVIRELRLHQERIDHVLDGLPCDNPRPAHRYVTDWIVTE